jgi:Na+/H+ antiporter NhaD/arsenite permease-like protein
MIDILGTVLPSAAGAPPLWTILPFAAYLLVIAVLPLFLPHFWEHNKNKLILAGVASLPVVAWLLLSADHGGHLLFDSLKEYVSFIVLLASLFIISGGVYLKGSLAGTPIVNTVMLGIGALLASFIGTTGASMLLIRPLLRANEKREKKVHLVIFFIFIVSNGAGMLTPLGDPPLFLGFLRGVPFFWTTLRLLAPWALVNGLLLVLFNIMDQMVLNKEEKARPGSQLEDVQKVKEPLQIQGGINFLWLLGVIAVIYVMGAHGNSISTNPNVQTLLQIVGMLGMAALSMKTTPKEIRAANKFGWGPIIEVAVIFIGIFVTMVPALKYLEAQGMHLGVTKPWQFFWASGALSSFLDNAPTYLTFASLGVGVVNQLVPGSGLTAENLGALAAHPLGATFLSAVSCGSVFMGANTYIGNGPNFMVKAIAEENKVKMPSFFGYMAWSCAILIPLFVVVTFIFFRG